MLPGFSSLAERAAPLAMIQFFEELRERKVFISQFEETALAAPYFSPVVSEAVAGRDVLHFADNQAANAPMARAWLNYSVTHSSSA